MSNEKTLLDPTAEITPAVRTLSKRHSDLTDKTIGLLDISKPRGEIFLNRLEEKLNDRGIKVLRYSKPTFTKPAPVDLRHEIATKCDAVIEALAD
mgnify:CR=1 FL=1